MSLKPLCLTPEALKSYTFKEFKNNFFKAVKKLAKKHNTAEVAAPFYLCAEQKFADAESEFFMIFGKLSKWKKYAKENALKTAALRGVCYISHDEEKQCLMINLMPVAGKLKAKENIIIKGLKTVISQSRCQITILKGEFTDDMMDKLEAATEAMEEVADDANADAMEDQVAQMAEMVADIKNQGLTPAQAKIIKALEDDIETIENLLEKMAAAKDMEELTATDKSLRTVFSKYVKPKAN